MLKLKQITCLTLAASLLLAPLPAQAAQSGTFTYGSFIGSNFQATFYYDDAYFREPSTKYTDSLATMSMCLALSAFASKGTDDYTKKSENLKALLTQCGFEEDTFAVNQGYMEKPGMDTIGVGAAAKKIKDENGEDCWLIACAVRGHGYQSEWASNFTIGEEGEHQGFESAARQVISFLETYAQEHPQISGNVKLWMAGYSRAAATVNLAAAMIDEGEKISDRFTLGTDSVYAYCFECPQGSLISLDAENSRYRNIFSIVNPADVVTKVAPTLPFDGFGFDRYGISKFLPSVMYDGLTRYEEQHEKMLEYYNQLGGTKDYQPEEFQMKKISVLDIWRGTVIVDDHNAAWNQETFLESLVSEIAMMIGNREEYVRSYQENVRQICKTLFGNKNAGAVMDNFADRICRQAPMIAGYTVSSPLKGTKPLMDCLEEQLLGALQDEGINDYSREDVHEVISNLANLIVTFGAVHPNYVATLASNLNGIAAGHYPEQCLAWLMSFDPNYGEGNHSEFSDSIYRMATVNGPFKMTVCDEEGGVAGRVMDGWIEETDETLIEDPQQRIVCTVDEDGEMTAFLPVRNSYTVEITGLEEGTGDCMIAEMSDQFGINRVVKYDELKLEPGRTVTLTVPAIADEELQRSYELRNGSSTPYTLTDENGQAAGTPTEQSGLEINYTRYRTRVYSSNSNFGRVEGGGVSGEGGYEQVIAFPYDGFRFTGWYEGKELVSEEETYRFRVDQDRILTARFEKIE